MNFGTVLRPSTEPVTSAVCSPKLRSIYAPTCSYRYCAVSENAVKISTLRLSLFSGSRCFSARVCSSVCSLLSCPGVMSATIPSKSCSVSKSVCKSRCHVR